MSQVYRYTFSAAVPTEEIEASLLLTELSVESLHGPSEARLDVSHFFDVATRTCVVDAATPAGRDFNKLFVGFLGREFGDDSFQVERVEAPLAAAAA